MSASSHPLVPPIERPRRYLTAQQAAEAILSSGIGSRGWTTDGHVELELAGGTYRRRGLSGNHARGYEDSQDLRRRLLAAVQKELER